MSMGMREKLATIMDEWLDDMAPLNLRRYLPVADSIIAAGFRYRRTITTEAELKELPDAAVIRDREGDVVERRGGKWCGYEAYLSDSQQAKFLPATVLDEGKQP